MNVLTSIKDHRINSYNLYVEASFGEYLSFAKNITANNDLQRKRVRTSKTVYSLLKTDLQKGCIIPPLVLAITNEDAFDLREVEKNGSILLNYIQKFPQNVLILDGLQRTLTLLDADAEMSRKDPEEYRNFLNFQLRLEIYLNINKFGVLYRMLTLNTGQTPMSARHQLEMLYSDMLNTQIEGVRLVSDTSGSADPSKNEFHFKNTVEGFHSYMNRNELPIDRQELLENIKMLENMANENVDHDLFKEFLKCYVEVFRTLREITKDHALSSDELEEYGISGSPFGVSVYKIFSTSQAMTGFGAAVGRMKDLEILNSFEDVILTLPTLKEKNSENEIDWLGQLLYHLDTIKASSKKIGNAQRMFFQYFFRELFNRDSDSYLNLENAVDNGYKKYYSQVN